MSENVKVVAQLKPFYNDCVNFFNQEERDLQGYFENTGREYSRHLNNKGYFAANLIKWGGAWALSVWVGFEYWKDVDIDASIMKMLTTTHLRL